jgi:hypothetical protein
MMRPKYIGTKILGFTGVDMDRPSAVRIGVWIDKRRNAVCVKGRSKAAKEVEERFPPRPAKELQRVLSRLRGEGFEMERTRTLRRVVY